MGRDKALLELDGRTLLERSVATLSDLVPRVLLACGSSPRYGQLGLECVLDRGAGLGPLAGLESALQRARAAGIPWLLALACDMPAASSAVFRLLLERARSEQADAALLASPEGLEPLHGLYRTSVLPALAHVLERGERRLCAFHEDIRLATLERDELPPGLRGCACNWNSPQDLAGPEGAR
jgi:molybdopterin-guanine dinucleotide biosynthesis protein A